jgi:hypothetical protein
MVETLINEGRGERLVEKRVVDSRLLEESEKQQ